MRREAIKTNQHNYSTCPGVPPFRGIYHQTGEAVSIYSIVAIEHNACELSYPETYSSGHGQLTALFVGVSSIRQTGN